MISIPSKPDQVTVDWLSQILCKKISRRPFVVSSNVQIGLGYMSQMIRIQAIDSITNQQLNLIIKLLPESNPDDPSILEVCLSQKYDVNEVHFYNQIFAQLTSEVSDLNQNLCPFYFALATQKPRASMIILEDLKPQGYTTKTYTDKLHMNQIEQVVKFIAKFHFAGRSVQFKNGRPLHELYPYIRKYEEGFEESVIFKWNMEGIVELDGFFKKFGNEEMRKDYLKLEQFYEKCYKSIFLGMNNEYSTLVHDDLWPNNFMIPDDPTKPVIVIDFQVLTYGEAAFDLAVLILASFSKEQLTRVNVDHLVKLYWDTFYKCLKESGLDGKGGFKWRDFEEFSQYFNTFGLAYGFLWFASHSPDTFENHLEKLGNIYEFLWKEAGIVEFLLENCCS